MNLKYFLFFILIWAGCQNRPEVTPEIQKETFANPVLADGADPWVVLHNNTFYYCYSSGGSIHVSQSDRLHEIGQGQKAAVWTPPENTMYSKELWAPELHFLNGKWYIYVAADDGNNHNHRMFVLESLTDDPLGLFVFKGKISSKQYSLIRKRTMPILL